MARIGLIHLNTNVNSFIKVVPPPPYTPPLDDLDQLPPIVRFKIECVVSNHVIIASQVTPEFVNVLKGVEEKAAVAALDRLEARQRREYNPIEFLQNEVSLTPTMSPPLVCTKYLRHISSLL